MYKTRIKTWGLTTYNKNGRSIIRRRAAGEGVGPGHGDQALELLGTSRNTRSANQARFPVSWSHETSLARHIEESHHYRPATWPDHIDVLAQHQMHSTIAADGIERFMRATMLHLQSSPSLGSFMLTVPKPTHLTSSEWDKNLICAMRECRIVRPTFEYYHEIMLSILYTKRGYLSLAGSHWSTAFLKIEDILRTGDPDFLMTLLWSVVELDGVGCSDVVSLLQTFLGKLIGMRTDRDHPLLLPFRLFADVDLHSIAWLKQSVAAMYFDSIRRTRSCYRHDDFRPLKSYKSILHTRTTLRIIVILDLVQQIYDGNQSAKAMNCHWPKGRVDKFVDSAVEEMQDMVDLGP